MRAFLFVVGSVAYFVVGTPLAAQWPGELRGRVVDASTGRGLAAVTVSLLDGTTQVSTDSGGGFHFRGLPPGVTTLVVRGLGFVREARRVEIRDGRVASLTIRMTPDPIEMQELTASVAGRRPGAVFRLDRTEIRASGARTLGAVLRRVPGLVVRSDRLGGPESISIRGSSSSAVLVLVDGAPLNDPVTGVADLSEVQLASISEIEVLSGAQSTAYGPGARAGVVLIRTGRATGRWRLLGAAGSLGMRSLDADVGRVGSTWSLSAGAFGSRVEGGFHFDAPDVIGGGRGTRQNADATKFGGRASIDGTFRGGRLAVRTSAEAVRRGLPGKSFIPSLTARSRSRRMRGAFAWSRSRAGVRTELAGFGQMAWLAVADTHPPLGLAFDTRSRVAEVGGRVSLSGERRGALARWTLATSIRSQWARSDGLAETAPARRIDGSVSASTESASFLRSTTRVRGALAAHRDPVAGGTRYTHTVGVDWGLGDWYVSLEQRSAFSQPTLSDQFFREGVAVASNPNLEAERIPSEFELATGTRWVRWSWTVTLRAAAFDGDVDGMIVWAPDFRFIWSPQNVDVNRRGVEVSASVEGQVGRGRIEARFAYGLADIAYRRPRPSQVIYRPRHSGAWGLTFTANGWSFASETTITGARYPVPSPINELPAFSTTDVRLSRSVVWGSRRVEASAHVRRIFNRRNNLIFGFPHPGRTIDISLGVQGFGTR